MLRRLATDFCLPLALGTCASFGFASFGWYGLTLLALVGLLGLWWTTPPGWAAWRGWLFGYACFSSGLYWYYVGAQVYGGAPVTAGLYWSVLLGAVLALTTAATGAFAAFTRPLPRVIWAFLLVPGAWVLGELLRGVISTGLPWLPVGYALVDAPLSPLIPLLGAYGMSFAMLATAGALLLLVTGGLIDRLAVLVAACALPLGLWLLPPAISWTTPSGAPIGIAILQGNASQGGQWNPVVLSLAMARYKRMTEVTDARLVVWPKIFVPSLDVGPSLQQVAALASQRGQTVLLGMTSVKHGTLSPPYSAVVALGVDNGRYYNRHQAPCGAYFSVSEAAHSAIKSASANNSHALGGPQHQKLIKVGGVVIGLNPCFEDTFGYASDRDAPAAGLLVSMGNDAGFANSSAPAQHFQTVRMRVLETGRPLLRAANSGISAVVDADGQVLHQTKPFVTTRIETTVQPRSGTTPYMRYGDKPLWALSLGIVVVGLLIDILWRK